MVRRVNDPPQSNPHRLDTKMPNVFTHRRTGVADAKGQGMAEIMCDHCCDFIEDESELVFVKDLFSSLHDMTMHYKCWQEVDNE